MNINNERVFDEIQTDLDGVLYEIHSTIEHVRVSSMLMGTTTTTKTTTTNGNNNNNENNCETPETSSSTPSSSLKHNSDSQLSVNEFTNKCNDLVDHCKTMINSALLAAASSSTPSSSTNMMSDQMQEQNQMLRFHIKNTMALVCSLIVQCFESCYVLLYRNEKLDEIRQLLIQILNLLNTFRSSLNVAYLFSMRKLNEKNSSLLVKQASNLENDISFLIEYFKIIF